MQLGIYGAFGDVLDIPVENPRGKPVLSLRSARYSIDRVHHGTFFCDALGTGQYAVLIDGYLLFDDIRDAQQNSRRTLQKIARAAEQEELAVR